MFRVGKTYETKKHGEFKCIAVSDTHAWMNSGKTNPAYVWTHNGKSTSLSEEYDIIMSAREYWIGPVSMLVYAYPVPGAIHFREVLPE